MPAQSFVNRLRIPLLISSVILLVQALPATPAEPVDLAAVTRIREEGFRRSQVMETVRYLTDTIGPRVTGSPQMKRANEWTRDKLAEWGSSAPASNPMSSAGAGRLRAPRSI